MRYDETRNCSEARFCGIRARRAILSSGAALAALLQTGAAFAQSAPAAEESASSGEIIVTARKREEDVQSVPQTIDVLGGQELKEFGKVTFKDLQYEVPGFYIENYESRATISMRGIGAQVPGNGASVASHVNGIYQATTAASLGWLFDVERVEVLKGPQGTLYGRNSTGGAINIITRKPGNDFGGTISAEYRNYNTKRVEAAVDVPLGGEWGVRVAGLVNRSDGRITNLFTGKKIAGNDFTGGRITLAGKAGPVDVELFAQYSDEKGGTGELIPLDPNFKPLYDWNKSYYDLPAGPEIERKYFVGGLTLSGDLGGGYSWRSVTGYLHYNEPRSFLDVNPRPAPVMLTIRFPQYAEQFSQEVAVLFQGDHINWVFGGLYMNESDGEKRRVDINPVLPGALDSASDNKIRTVALFGDLNYNLTNELRLNVGLRYNNDRVHNKFNGQGAFDGQSFDLTSTQAQVTGRIGLDYTTSSGTLIYASVAKGFQAGYNDVGFTTSGVPAPATVDPERLIAYEVGLKSRLPGKFGSFDVAGFYYDYRDMQVLVGGIPLLPDGTPDPNGVPFFTTLNAGKARLYGIDASLADLRVSMHLKFDFNLEYLNAKFQDYKSIDDFGNPADYAGNTLPRAPKFSGTSAVTFDRLAIGPAVASLRFEYQYRSKAFDAANNLYQLQATGLFNALATIDLDGGKWRLTASGRNLGNKKYFAFFDGRNFGYPGGFRTWSIGLTHNF